MIELIYLAIGLLLLVKGADYFVESAARIARKLGVSELVIGLTLTAIGTSVPELAATVTASLEDKPGLIIGNVVGSNIANIGLILGVATVVARLSIDGKVFLREGYILLLSAISFYAVSYDGLVTPIEGGVMLVLYITYILFLIKTRTNDKAYAFHDFLDYFFNFEYITTIKGAVSRKKSKAQQKRLALFKEGLLADFFIAIASLVGIVYGSRFLVDSSVWLADTLGIPQNLIGLSIIAIGTSLPELSVTISAARKGLSGIILGNVIGSNIANSLMIIGTSSMLGPLTVSTQSRIYLIPIMGFFTVAFLYFLKNQKLEKKEGTILLGAYILFMAGAFIFSWA